MYDMTPEIKLEAPPEYRRCYCCGEASVFELVIGHRTDNGRNGNTHSVALCSSCKDLVSLVLAE